MTCEHCCDANKQFDSKVAAKQMKTYKKKGVSGTTKKIISELEKIDFKGKKMIDIGGGVGALQWYFLNRGGNSTTSVEASAAYTREAKKVAIENSWLDKVTFMEGDFNDLVEGIDSADIVSLDKVICCYPDYQRILKNSINKTSEYLVLSYPRSTWISQSLNSVMALVQKLKKSAFRSYIHPVKKVRELITEHQMSLIGESRSFPWIIELYQKA